MKASPEPSEKYGDTVCVAGVRLDGPSPSWIRLYPVPLRYMTSESQFHKYDVVEVDLLPPVADKRPESHRIDTDSVRTTGHPIKSASARGAILEPLVGPTMCDLHNGVVADHNAPSLGLVPVREVLGLDIKPGKPWTEAQQRKVDQAVAREPLFGEAPPELKPPRFQAWYRYRCESLTCKTHTQGILDWELTALQLHLRHDSDKDAMAKIREKFLDELCSPSKRVHFFVGNIAEPQKRRNFSVLGVYGPPLSSSYAGTFDLGI